MKPTMNAQIPLPSFEDIQKILGFWIDQQDKWFYFETGAIQSGSTGEIQNPPKNISRSSPTWDKINETFQYTQSRIAGKIYDVVSYPPSLLLQDVTVFTVNLTVGNNNVDVLNIEKRNRYGLVFSQITYYEPIDNVESFLKDDPRIGNLRRLPE